MRTILMVLLLVAYSMKRIGCRPNSQDIPEAPTLAPLHYNALPEYVRSIISTENPNTLNTSVKNKYSQTKISQNSNKNILEKKRRTNIEVDNPLNNEVAKVTTAGDWGINLKSGNGYVWKVHHPRSDSTEKTDSHREVQTSISHDNTEVNTEEYYTENENENSTDDPVIDYEATSWEEAEFPPGTWGMRLHNGDGYVWNGLTNNSGLRFDVGSTGAVNKLGVTSTSRPPPRKMEGSGVSKKDHRKETPVLSPAENGDAKTLKEKEVAKDVAVGKETQEPTNKGYYSKYEDVNPFIYHENIDRFKETEPFWKWLEGWTSSYVKKLVENVLMEVKEDLNKRKLNVQSNVTVHETDTTGKTEADKKNTTDEKTPEYKRNITQTTKPQNTSTVITCKNDENQDQDAKASIEEYKGTVIPKVYSKPNLGKGETKLKQAKPEIDITSKVIYGNSVGNDKVTNVYIFYPRGTDEGIEKLKPLLDLVDPESETERPTQNPVGVKDSETVAKKIDDAATFIKNETKHNDQIFNNTKEDSNESEKRHEEKENPKDLNNGENFKQNTGSYNEANAIIKIEKNSKDESKKENTIDETTKTGEELSTELEIDERTNKKEEHTGSKEDIVKDELNGPDAKAGVELHNKRDSNETVELN